MPANPYAEKTVLVTGGTGSFGNFVVRRLLDLGAREVRVLSRDEKKQHDMRVFYQPGAVVGLGHPISGEP